MGHCPECAETLKHPGQNHAWTVAGHCAIAGCTAIRAVPVKQDDSIPELDPGDEWGHLKDHPAPVDPASVDKLKAEALREAANAYWDDTTQSLRKSVTQWLHERADRLEQPGPEPEKVRAWTQWLADHGAGRNGVAETLVRAGVEVPDA